MATPDRFEIVVMYLQDRNAFPAKLWNSYNRSILVTYYLNTYLLATVSLEVFQLPNLVPVFYLVKSPPIL